MFKEFKKKIEFSIFGVTFLPFGFNIDIDFVLWLIFIFNEG